MPEFLFEHLPLSSRFNRIIQDCGRAVIRARLADFQDRFGLTSSEVSPASTSQTCSYCAYYIPKRNRPSQSAFRCP